MKIAFLTLGLHEKSDSVGYDCVSQFNTLKEGRQGLTSVRMFADTFKPSNYPGLPVGNAEAFYQWCEANPEGLIVYHYCDSRSKFDDLLRERRGPVVIRWHNNTPPWFNFGAHNQNAIQSLSGFENLCEFIAAPHVRFWVNSDFTRDQLLALGCAPERCSTVFPASRYLSPGGMSTKVRRPERFAAQALNLLFVGRVVAHKGHLSAIAVAKRAAAAGQPIVLHFAGRPDPGLSQFNRELRREAANSGFEVIFHGEVSEDALAALYSQADVFLCLSEHEGFGLPVLEAIRCRIPVVAWATAALAELLRDHPLAFLQHDLALFAAGVLALRDQAVRARVLAAQDGVLGRYTAAIVGRQLAGAVASAKVEVSHVTRPVSPALQADPALRGALHAWMDKAAATASPAPFPLLHDSGSNLVALYDLAQYRSFFDGQKAMRLAVLSADNIEPLVVFQPSEFASRGGLIDDNKLRLPEAHYGTEHLIYGPYAEFPTGRYEAMFDITLTSANPGIMFELDVSAQEVGVLGRAALTPATSSPVPVAFSIDAERALLEFRLRSLAAFKGGVTLRGVTIRMLAGPQASPLESSHRTRRLWGRIIESVPLGAWRHFRNADHYRDAGQWLKAADEYRRGLRLAPRKFPFYVQHGHMLKEAGLFSDAEAAYCKALELKPDDPDLNLHLGHLYKRMNRQRDAETHYFRALAQNRTGLDAAEELANLGVSVGALRKRMAHQ